MEEEDLGCGFSLEEQTVRPAGPPLHGCHEPVDTSVQALQCLQGAEGLGQGHLREVVWGGGSALWVRSGGVGGGLPCHLYKA